MTICAGNSVTKIEIDLRGPKGDAMMILGTAWALALQLGWSQDRRDTLTDEMTSADYRHLVDTFERYFGLYVDIYGYDEIFGNE